MLASRLMLAAAALSASASQVMAQSYASCSWWYAWRCSGGTTTTTTSTRPTASSVPEIDASTGLIALVAVLAVVAYTWDRRRRANRA
ncbi:hypothetical protein E7811_05935 [Aliigemmobacter aestuarii]|uniref:VPEID-CTERM sorting domain-containing protein n=1 Tax=Aliigemmobacter aestuarii TaxID=1445661 RepID=A0A4S3MTN6_9RHOB|nr:hypothetical protein [Gemmobacter aestuarii]THD85245.1 hypothetical protein E7811_05935 [Gemmobacter aestuarii]